MRPGHIRLEIQPAAKAGRCIVDTALYILLLNLRVDDEMAAHKFLSHKIRLESTIAGLFCKAEHLGM